MSTQQPSWWEWADLDRPGSEPLRLREDAPEDVKAEFERWKKKKAAEQAAGFWI
jgi:hypothetical protein